MYCTKCGAQNDDNNMFCFKCGNKLVPSNESPSVEGSSISALSETIIDLGNIIDPLKKIEGLSSRLSALKNQQESVEHRRNLYIIIFDVIVVLIVFAIANDIIGRSHFYFFNIIILFAVIFGYFFLFIYSFKHFGVNRANKEKQEYQNQIDVVTRQCENLANTVYPVLSQYLPQDYWYSTAVQSITSYFKNGRADNMKEAINLYEEEMVRLKMVNMQAAIYRENQKQTGLLILNLLK